MIDTTKLRELAQTDWAKASGKWALLEAAADDLDADRKALLVIAAVDRQRRILRHIPRHGKADVLERLCRIVER